MPIRHSRHFVIPTLVALLGLSACGGNGADALPTLDGAPALLIGHRAAIASTCTGWPPSHGGVPARR